MKVLTSRYIFREVARRVLVNTTWIAVFVAPPLIYSYWPLPLFPAALAVTAILAVIYGLALWATVAFAKWLIPKMKDEERFSTAGDEEKARWIVSAIWWGF